MIREIANLDDDVKDNGNSFGYDPMTAIGGSLSTFRRAIGGSETAAARPAWIWW